MLSEGHYYDDGCFCVSVGILSIGLKEMEMTRERQRARVMGCNGSENRVSRKKKQGVVHLEELCPVESLTTTNLSTPTTHALPDPANVLASSFVVFFFF